MRKSAVYATKKTLAEGFVAVSFNELEALEALPSWMTKLFLNLVRFTNFQTGRGESTYAALLRRLTPIQPRSGPKHFVPDAQALKKAIRLLEDRGLLRRDKRASQEEGSLIYVVLPRVAPARPKAELEPPTRTPAKREKRPIHRGSEATGQGTRTPDSNPSSTGCISHIESSELPTDGGVLRPPEPPNPPGPIAVPGEGKIGPPRGPECRPDGHAPRETPTQREMKAAMRRARSSAPPGGQDDAPLRAEPLSARLRRPRTPVLMKDAGKGSGGD